MMVYADIQVSLCDTSKIRVLLNLWHKKMQMSFYFCHCLLYSYTDESMEMSHHMILCYFKEKKKKEIKKSIHFGLQIVVLS